MCSKIESWLPRIVLEDLQATFVIESDLQVGFGQIVKIGFVIGKRILADHQETSSDKNCHSYNLLIPNVEMEMWELSPSFRM